MPIVYLAITMKLFLQVSTFCTHETITDATVFCDINTVQIFKKHEKD